MEPPCSGARRRAPARGTVEASLTVFKLKDLLSAAAQCMAALVAFLLRRGE
jgi:hypothetical protein